MTKLYTDHLETKTGIKHKRFAQLEDRDRNPEYETLKVVPSESSDKAYIVAEISFLTKPMGKADIVEDTAHGYLCSCDDFYYNRSGGLESDADPTNMGKCKHVISAFRTEKAKNDPNQQEIYGERWPTHTK